MINIGTLFYLVFNSLRFYVLAAHQHDSILCSTGDNKLSVFRLNSQITSIQPPFIVYHFSGSLGVFIVALHDLRTTHIQNPFLAYFRQSHVFPSNLHLCVYKGVTRRPQGIPAEGAAESSPRPSSSAMTLSSVETDRINQVF